MEISQRPLRSSCFRNVRRRDAIKNFNSKSRGEFPLMRTRCALSLTFFSAKKARKFARRMCLHFLPQALSASAEAVMARKSCAQKLRSRRLVGSCRQL
jgi:hypothetical protein